MRGTKQSILDHKRTIIQEHYMLIIPIKHYKNNPNHYNKSMLWILSPLISSIVIGLLRLWILRQIFQHTDKKSFFFTSISSSISVIIISLVYILRQYLSIDSTTMIIIVTSITLLSSILYFHYQRFIWRISQSVVWIVFALLWWMTGVYSISALWEESFKRIYIKKFISWLLGEIILLWIVSGIVFGWTENLVYIVTSLIQNATHSEALSLVQQRWILPLIVHIWSLCLALMVWFHFKTKTPPAFARSIALISGIGSHVLFNLSQSYQFSLGTAIIILLYLIIISYSLFRSDVLYISKNNANSMS